MKNMYWMMFIAVLLGASSARAQVGGPPKDARQAMYMSMDLYGQASYFHAIVAQRRCDLLDPDTVSATNQLFDNVRSQLAARYGDAFSKIDKPINPPNEGRECDRATLDSYRNHVAQVEQVLQEGSAFSH